MAKALDGHGPEGYRCGPKFRQFTQEMIARIRASKPSCDLYSIRGSTYVGYPSTKMRDLIRAESCRVEFPPSILELEYRTECEEDF